MQIYSFRWNKNEINQKLGISSTARTLWLLVQLGTCMYVCILSVFVLCTGLRWTDTPSKEFYEVYKGLTGSGINSELEQATGSNPLRWRKKGEEEVKDGEDKKGGREEEQEEQEEQEFESFAVLYSKIANALSYFCKTINHTNNCNL
jgi:hypothetical protein